jgi:very-short-patch-repair endonuclease
MHYEAVFNAKRMTGRRKQLRKNQTSAENILWTHLRDRKLGIKFKRQYSLSNYVIDFYSPEKLLAIEIDGRIHYFKKVYDDYREKYLQGFGIKILRFTNDQVINNLPDVLEIITKTISNI